jgi:hypothetical protein
MNSDEDRRRRFGRLPLALKPRARLELEMLVLDGDRLDAQEFLAERGVEAGDEADPLVVCKEWLKRIREAEQGRLRIRYDDKGPTMDLT